MPVVPFPAARSPLPRLLRARHARLVDGVIDLMVAVHGANKVRARMRDRALRHALDALTFAPDAPDDDRAPLFVDDARLAACALAARAPLPAPLTRLSAEPGLGPRTLFALALVADLALSRGATADPDRFRFAFGALDGVPYFVPLVVVDRALVVLERGASAALVELAAEVDARARGARPVDRARVIVKERAIARDLVACSRHGLVDAGARAPRIPRRAVARAVQHELFVP